MSKKTKKKVAPPTNRERTDAHSAFFYARDDLKGRFPDGEAVIAKHPVYAVCYAVEIVKGRWQEGESAILGNDKADSTDEMNFDFKQIIADLSEHTERSDENLIMDATFTYAREVFKGRLPKELEDVVLMKSISFISILMKSISFISKYITEIIKDRWPEAEAEIAKRAAASAPEQRMSRKIKTKTEEDEARLPSVSMVLEMAFFQSALADAGIDLPHDWLDTALQQSAPKS